MNTVFAIGTGRCGTKFLYEVFSREPKVASFHERHPLNDTFHRFCKWYAIDVDHENFLATKEQGILNDLKKNILSFEASAYLSFSVLELYKKFNAKFILLVRHPEKVVNSYYSKGWYKEEVVISDPAKIPSYYEVQRPHHFFGRTLPKGDAFFAWDKMTRIGKLAWFWSSLNSETIKLLRQLPAENFRIEKLEDLNYQKYVELSTFSGITTVLKQKQFEKIVSQKPNKQKGNRSGTDWSAGEKSEFKQQVEVLATTFNYSI